MTLSCWNIISVYTGGGGWDFVRLNAHHIRRYDNGPGPVLCLILSSHTNLDYVPTTVNTT